MQFEVDVEEIKSICTLNQISHGLFCKLRTFGAFTADIAGDAGEHTRQFDLIFCS